MGRRLGLVALACASLLAAGCNDDASETTLTVEGTISVCSLDRCVDLPAAGATGTIYDETGKQVEQGTLDSRGRLNVAVPEGTYEATLSMDDLGLRTRRVDSPSVDVFDGDSGLLALALPPLQVRP